MCGDYYSYSWHFPRANKFKTQAIFCPINATRINQRVNVFFFLINRIIAFDIILSFRRTRRLNTILLYYSSCTYLKLNNNNNKKKKFAFASRLIDCSRHYLLTHSHSFKIEFYTLTIFLNKILVEILYYLSIRKSANKNFFGRSWSDG